jgi:hypothetical protein
MRQTERREGGGLKYELEQDHTRSPSFHADLDEEISGIIFHRARQDQREQDHIRVSKKAGS